MTRNEVFKRLKAGNERYMKNVLKHEFQDADRRYETAEGQEPYATVLACADSRMVPEIVFDTGIGELFVIRVAGNIANTSSVASIEFAVNQLDTEVIVVLGHQNCGAVTAAVQGGDLGRNLNHLVAHITPALYSADSKEVNTVVKENARKTAEELLSRSPIITQAVKDKKVIIVPAYYHLDTGEVEFLI